MSRGVNYLNDAVEITYFDVSSMGQETVYKYDCECGEQWESYGSNEDCEDCGETVTPEEDESFDEFQNEMEWDDFKDNIIASLEKKYPSFWEVEEWDNNETKIILRNSLVEIGLSEYCGCASLSIRVVPESDYEYVEEYTRRENLALSFINKTWNNMMKVLDKNVGYTRLNRIGGFSNGESVYEKAK